MRDVVVCHLERVVSKKMKNPRERDATANFSRTKNRLIFLQQQGTLVSIISPQMETACNQSSLVLMGMNLC